MQQMVSFRSLFHLRLTALERANLPSNESVKYMVLVASNVAGLLLYLYFSSLVWAPPGEEGLLGGPGEAAIWTLFALPWLVICSFLNLLMFRTVCARFILYGKWIPMLTFVAFIGLWIGAFKLDFSRHYNGSLVRTDETIRSKR